MRPAVQLQLPSPLQVISPLSKVKKDVATASEAAMSQKDKVGVGAGTGLKAKTYGAAGGAKR
jgi:hypothetical protein